MRLNAQEIFMPEVIKKISLIFLTVFVLSSFVFLGTSYSSSPLASLFGMIRAWVTINPLTVNVSVPSEVEIDKIFMVVVEIGNKGEKQIKNAQGVIFLPEGLLLKKKSAQAIGVISDRKKKKIQWPIKGEEGNYIITVKVSGELEGNELTKEVSAKVLIKEKDLKSQSRWARFFERLLNFFQ